MQKRIEMKKKDEKQFEKSRGSSINSFILVKNRKFNILVKKMHTGHKEKNITHA